MDGRIIINGDAVCARNNFFLPMSKKWVRKESGPILTISVGELIMYSDGLLGHSLSDKMGLFKTDCVEEIEFNHTAFDSLLLRGDHERSLVPFN